MNTVTSISLTSHPTPSCSTTLYPHPNRPVSTVRESLQQNPGHWLAQTSLLASPSKHVGLKAKPCLASALCSAHSTHQLCIYTFLIILFKDIILRCIWRGSYQDGLQALFIILENAKHLKCPALIEFGAFILVLLKNLAGILNTADSDVKGSSSCTGHAKLQISIL